MSDLYPSDSDNPPVSGPSRHRYNTRSASASSYASEAEPASFRTPVPKKNPMKTLNIGESRRAATSDLFNTGKGKAAVNPANIPLPSTEDTDYESATARDQRSPSSTRTKILNPGLNLASLPFYDPSRMHPVPSQFASSRHLNDYLKSVPSAADYLFAFLQDTSREYSTLVKENSDSRASLQATISEKEDALRQAGELLNEL